MEEARARWIASVVGAGLSESLSLPFDVLKTRLQVRMQGASLVSVATQMIREEGVRSFWKGLSPALLRQLAYHPLAMVLYSPIREALSSTQEASFGARLMSGGLSGSIAIFVFNWTEVIKTQLQTDRLRTSATMGSVVARIYRNAGLLGFWAGVVPNIARTFVVNAVELGSYDELKTVVFSPLLGNSSLCHLSASATAGVLSAIVSTPVDVVKTRLMNASGTSASLSSSSYSSSLPSRAPSARGSVLTTFKTIYKEEGIRSLYAGVLPICLRKIIWCTSFFVAYEQLLLRFQNGEGE